jgi:hypothetical protein
VEHHLHLRSNHNHISVQEGRPGPNPFRILHIHFPFRNLSFLLTQALADPLNFDWFFFSLWRITVHSTDSHGRLDLRVDGRYKLGKKIDSVLSVCWLSHRPKTIHSKSFASGDIYLGINIISGEEVAIKHPQLEYQS